MKTRVSLRYFVSYCCFKPEKNRSLFYLASSSAKSIKGIHCSTKRNIFEKTIPSWKRFLFVLFREKFYKRLK